MRGLAPTPYGILAGRASRQRAFVRGTERRVMRRQRPWILRLAHLGAVLVHTTKGGGRNVK